MDEIISHKMCAVNVRNAKLRNYLKEGTFNTTLNYRYVMIFTSIYSPLSFYFVGDIFGHGCHWCHPMFFWHMLS